MTTVVIFRKYKKVEPPADNLCDVIAVFPEIPADYNGSFPQSYEHIGQHGGCKYHGILTQTVPATPEEYAPLMAELKKIGYKDLVVSQKCLRIHDRARRKEAQELRQEGGELPNTQGYAL